MTTSETQSQSGSASESTVKKTVKRRSVSRDVHDASRRERRRARRELEYQSSSESEDEEISDGGGGSKWKNEKVRGLPDFNGTNMTVERFLSKFKRCTKHYQWNRTERRFQLEAALKGAPEEIITEGGDDMSEREIIREMKLRYGNASRIRSFRTQLETVKQLPGQSLQDVYHEVKRILTLAYPTTDRETKESIGCNAFFRALTDQDMSTNLQVQDPEDLAEALTIALRLEPIYKANIGKKVTGRWRRLRRTYGSWRRRTTLTCATRSGGCRRNWGTRKGTSSHGGPRTSGRANLRPSLTNLLNLVRSRTRPYSRRHWLYQYLLGLALHSRRWLHNLQLQFVYPPHGYAPRVSRA